MDLRTYRKDCLLGTLGALLMLVGNLCLTEGMAAFMPVYKLLGGDTPLIRNISNKIVVLEK